MLTRRVLSTLAALASGAIAVALFSTFLWPEAPVTQREVELGRAEAFPAGTVTTFRLLDGEDAPVRLSPAAWIGPSCPTEQAWTGFEGIVVHLVRLKDGTFLALSGESPHLGEVVLWLPEFTWEGETGWFREPCHGDTYAMDGARVFGPAPRGLDRFAVRVVGGVVKVDPLEVAEGAPSPLP